MAPRKRGRQAASTDVDEGANSESHANIKAVEKKNAAESRQWTDEQEIALLKSIIKWKPVGIHAHFRMGAIVESLRNSGTVSSSEEQISPAEVWEKLGELYNLETLDEREDEFGYPIQKDATDEPFGDFALPDEDFKDCMFAKRLAPGPPSSPPILPYQLSGGLSSAARRQSTIDDSEEPRSSPAVSSRGQRGGRGWRGVRASQLIAASRTRRSGRMSRASVEESAEGEGEAAEGTEDAMEVDEDEEKEEGRSSRSTANKTSTRRSGRKR